jgi:hypothetical protein
LFQKSCGRFFPKGTPHALAALSKPHGLYYREYAGRNDGSNRSIKIKKGEADFGKLTPNPNIPRSFLSG